ncbi:MAG: PAS domain S-box protein [Anaerolineales bacterium]|nr:PAS domain S-box protein [Anaerolineales bacterium]
MIPPTQSETPDDDSNRYRALFENMVNGLAYCRLLYDSTGKAVDFEYLEVNPAFEQMTQWKDVIGKRVSELLPGIHESNPELLDHYGRVAETGIPERFDFKIARLGAWIRVSVFSHRPGTFIAELENIDEYKVLEESLRRSEARFRTIVDIAPVPLVLTRVSDGTFQYVNPLAADLMGVAQESAIGRKVEDFYADPSQRAEIIADVKKHGAIQNKEILFRRANGEIIRASLSAVVTMANGEPIFLGALIDTTEQHRAMDALRESEVRHRFLADNVHDVIWMADPHGVFTYFSPSVVRLRGFTAEESLRQRLDEQFTPASCKILVKTLQWASRAIASEVAIEPARLELEIICKGGGTVWTEATVNPLYDGSGKFTGFVGVTRDISERKRVQDALIRSEERLALATRAALIGVWEWDLQTGNQRWNKQIYEIYGHPETTVPSYASWEAAVHPDDRTAAVAVERTGVVNRERSALQYRIIRPDGEIRWIYSAEDVITDTAGNAVRVVGVNMDITDQKKNEDTLAHLATIVEDADDAILSLTLNGTIVSWNRGAERLYGYRAAEVIGQPITILLPPDDSENPLHLLAGIGDDTDIHHYEARRVAKSGRVVDVALTISPMRDSSGRLIGASTIARDITERKSIEKALLHAKEAAEQADRAKSLFLANMSHEIRTPMNAITGLTSLLLDTPLTHEQHDYIETIRQSANALLNVINEVLDFSKIESGNLELEMQPFSLAQCIEDALDLFTVPAAEKGIELTYQIAADIPDAFDGDVTRIRQILVNLIGNAVKFTERGEVAIDVSQDIDAVHLRRTDTSLVLQFAVRDTGVGIPSDRSDRLFRSFSQADASTTRKYGGTGLGLAISRRLAELMGGAMWVVSEVGRGSTFLFTLRLQPLAKPVNTSALTNVQGVRVLIVDDNATNRFIIQEQTRRRGIVATAVSSGVAALELIDSGTGFDLIILDMLMPQMNGLELAAQLRARPATRETPLVVLTSLGDSYLRAEAEALGVAAFVSKPVKQTQFLRFWNVHCNPMGPTTAIKSAAVSLTVVWPNGIHCAFC